jgi:hypothetical protein
MKSNESQMHALEAIEVIVISFIKYFKHILLQKQVLSSLSRLEKVCGQILHLFYEHDILSETCILQWYELISEKDDDDDDSKDEEKVHPLIASCATFIQWLKESEEDSDSD